MAAALSLPLTLTGVPWRETLNCNHAERKSGFDAPPLRQKSPESTRALCHLSSRLRLKRQRWAHTPPPPSQGARLRCFLSLAAGITPALSVIQSRNQLEREFSDNRSAVPERSRSWLCVALARCINTCANMCMYADTNMARCS